MLPTTASRLSSIATLAILACAVFGSPLVAQQLPGGNGTTAPGGGLLESLGEFTPGAARDPVSVAAALRFSPGASNGRLVVTTRIEDGFHIYSLSQPKGGPLATKIRLVRIEGVKLLGPFEPDRAPKAHIGTEVWKGLRIEEHAGEVVFSAPVERTLSADSPAIVVEGVVETQACDEAVGCIPLAIDFTARTAGAMQIGSVGRDDPQPSVSLPKTADPPVAPTSQLAARFVSVPTPTGKYQQTGSHVKLIGEIRPAHVAPGESADLLLTAVPEAGWHVYARADRDPNALGNKPTLITIESADGLRVFRAETTSEIHQGAGTPDFPATPHHEGPVTWRIRIEVPADAALGRRMIFGTVGFQVCAEQCERPQGAHFQAALAVDAPGAAPGADAAPIAFVPARYRDAAKLANAAYGVVSAGPKTAIAMRGAAVPAEPGSPLRPAGNGIISASSDNGNPPTESGGTSLPWMLLYGFVGGIILNVMPCVLPVIGLKVFAFIEQAGESRAKVFALNFWYALGVISVFMVLATLAVVFQLGWGALFQLKEFNIVMAAVIFAMGLSFLGVWEIPIPGFIGTSKVTDIGAKEGYEGAFAKGTITTILATPCTGPFMGTAIAGLVSRSAPEIFAIFFAIGLGMSSPYLVIGAMPELIRFLPKPGEWMNTFKQFMGFVLLGTVAFILTSLRPFHLVVPTVAFLFGVWLCCWWVGRVPATAESSRRWRALGESILVGSLIGLFAFTWLSPIMADRHEQQAIRLADAQLEKWADEGVIDFFVRKEPWQPYTERKLDFLKANDKTVLVDFTADWCSTCKVLESTVLRTEATSKLIEELGVYTLVADWTEKEAAVEEDRKLRELGSQQVPVLAIFPAGQFDNPIVLLGGYTTGELHTILRDVAEGKRPAGGTNTGSTSAPLRRTAAATSR